MSIQILAASEARKPELRKMLTNYLEELGQYGTVDLEYPYLDSYWTDTDRWPYFIVKDRIAVGFALLNTESQSGTETDVAIAEFFVRREFRGAGVGKQAFALLLGAHSGVWEFGVMPNNRIGKAFWQKALASAGVTYKQMTNPDGAFIYRFSNKT